MTAVAIFAIFLLIFQGKFPTFAKYRDVFNAPNFAYDFRDQDCIFMRWKVRHLCIAFDFS